MTREPINNEQASLSREDTLFNPDSASVVTPLAGDQATHSASLVTPLPLAQANRALPRQYFRVLTKPSVVTFAKEMGKASWNMVWVQLIGLGTITALLYCDHLRLSSVRSCSAHLPGSAAGPWNHGGASSDGGKSCNSDHRSNSTVTHNQFLFEFFPGICIRTLASYLIDTWGTYVCSDFLRKNDLSEAREIPSQFP